MDPVSQVVTALLLGAANGLGESATTAVKDAYSSLRGLVAGRFAGDQAKEVVLAEYPKRPETWTAPLTEALIDSGAAQDPAVREAAARLMELLEAAGISRNNYAVDARNAQGVQIGDRNTQTNTFGAPPTVRRANPEASL